MKIAIFGATGRSGLPLVRKALDAGHEVVAMVRTPAKLPLEHDCLQVVQGDILDGQRVAQALRGVDAVISVLGPTNNRDDIMGPAAQNIIAGMQKHGVRRLLTVTGAGVEDANDQPKLVNRLISFLLKTTAAKVYEQSVHHVQLVRQSGLDWTVVRVPMLTEQPGSGQVRVGYVGKGTGTRLSRTDLADFLLAELTTRQHVHQAPVISN